MLDQGIDTSTAEGRAMFGMLSVLAELQRELIIANTRDGLASARARGRIGGRRPKLNAEQAQHAQQLYDDGQHTVQQIADLLRVPRTTIYGHLNKTATGRRTASASASAQQPRRRCLNGRSCSAATQTPSTRGSVRLRAVPVRRTRPPDAQNEPPGGCTESGPLEWIFDNPEAHTTMADFRWPRSLDE